MTHFSTYFDKLRRRTFVRVFFLALVVGIYGLIPICKEYSEWRILWDIPSNFHAILSLVLGSLLVFRTNTSYNRWWEARTLWGDLVNASRNLAAKLGQLVTLPRADLLEAEQDIIGFCRSLKNQLRGNFESKLERNAEGELLPPRDVPTLLIGRRYAALKHWKNAGHIDGDELRVIDVELTKFLEILGGCERIRSTRIVRSFRIFARQSVLIYLVTLPWALVHDFGWWTILISMIAAYFMLGLEIVAEHVEEPFGYDEDDLDLDRFCDVIERSVHEIFAFNGAFDKSTSKT